MENLKIKTIIVGGTYLKRDEEIVKTLYAKGEIGVSNQEYERKLIQGFETCELDYVFLSAPYVGSWPVNCKRMFVRNLAETSNFVIAPYSTIIGFSSISKTRSLKKSSECSANKFLAMILCMWFYANSTSLICTLARLQKNCLKNVKCL